MAPRKPDEELYDMWSDPCEINSLAVLPEYDKTLKQMRAIVEKWIAETADMGQFQEKLSEIPARDRERIVEDKSWPYGNSDPR